jgi:ribosomal protein L19E
MEARCGNGSDGERESVADSRISEASEIDLERVMHDSRSRTEKEAAMMEHSTWDDVRRIVDELEVKIHLAKMEARDRWQALQPRLEKLEKTIEEQGERAGRAVADEVSEIGRSLRELRDEIVDDFAARN